MAWSFDIHWSGLQELQVAMKHVTVQVEQKGPVPVLLLGSKFPQPRHLRNDHCGF